MSIMWIYNDLNPAWKEQLSDEIKDLIDNKDGQYHLKNIPNYKTLFQNPKEAFALTPEQINLMANMWYYSLTEDNELRRTIESFVE